MSMASDYDDSGLAPQLQKTYVHNNTYALSLQELDLQFSPLFEEYFTPGNQSVSQSFAFFDNSQQRDTQPTLNVQPTTEPIIQPTTVMLRKTTLINQQMHSLNHMNLSTHSVYRSDYHWTKDHPLEQVRGNPSKPVQTRRQLSTDPKMCMFALTLDGCVDPDHPEKVYRLRKALYGLKQASRAWYDKLSTFLMSKGFTKVRAMETHLKEVKRFFRYLKETINMGLWYLNDFGFELIAFSDVDHARCFDTRKSTSGGIQFLGEKLVNWMSKKQDCTTMSTAEAEYVALSASCAQVMWMRTQLKDYGFNYNRIPLYCDSQSAIAISCNPVQHSRTKHINVR
nr:uncharacterized mitochondrial protein AtMg00810-like [Tanacetum cinerariifolium]